MSTLFRYETQGRPVTYLDTEDQYDAEFMRKHWSAHFSELGNCQSEVKQAGAGEKLKGLTQEGEEVEVDRIITYAKKVGTKGLPIDDQVGPLTEDEARAIIERATAPDSTAADRQRFYAHSRQSLSSVRALMTEAFALHSDPARKRLIDAAPRMLAALQWAVDYVRTHEPDVCPFCQLDREASGLHMGDCPWPLIRQAIADATGETLAGEVGDGG